MRPHILIVSVADDAPARRVEQELRHRGAQVSWFDCAEFPVRSRLTTSFAPEGESLQLDLASGIIPLHALEGIWFRKPGPPSAAPEISDAAMRELCESDCADFLTAVWDLTGCRALPAAPAVMIRKQRKAPQLQRARALGFQIPPTLFTNDPQCFLDFYREHDGRIVSKITGTMNLRRYTGPEFARYTEPVSTRDVAYARSVAYCPMIFQAYVPKRLELRITVVGSRVFAAEIHSQVTNRTKHDWRHYDLAATPHREHALPERIARLCRALVQELDLLYGAIDMILTPDGEYVFLEINPSGEYGWIEDLTGLPISAAIADVLLGRDPAVRPVASANQESCHA